MDIEQTFVHLARLALANQDRDLRQLVRRTLPRIAESRPDLGKEIESLLKKSTTPITRSRSQKQQVVPLPVDVDSRLELLRQDDHPTLPVSPTWPEPIQKMLDQFIAERRQEDQLIEKGIMPTRSLLFVGPPGVGKSLAASYLAIELNRPLLTLDLAAVMSSFLGRTGNNIRAVLDYSRQLHSILLLDEFDAIAKRRDDSAEVGELKRLVTVLLQAIDTWPTDGILLAATNHPDLLDPAVWRRFDRIIEFPLPSTDNITAAIGEILQEDLKLIRTETVELLASVFHELSFADVRKFILSAQRDAFIKRIPIEAILNELAMELLQSRSHAERVDAAVSLLQQGWPERSVREMTGIARDTFRKKRIERVRRPTRNGKRA